MQGCTPPNSSSACLSAEHAIKAELTILPQHTLDLMDTVCINQASHLDTIHHYGCQRLSVWHALLRRKRLKANSSDLSCLAVWLCVIRSLWQQMSQTLRRRLTSCECGASQTVTKWMTGATVEAIPSRRLIHSQQDQILIWSNAESEHLKVYLWFL